MMDDERDRAKYMELNRKLIQIRQEMSTINSVCNDIYRIANNCVKIDNQVIDGNSFRDLKNKNQNVVNSINSTISLVQRKL